MNHPDPHADEHADRFTLLRPLLFTIAYEILGSATEADDVLQDSYLRWATVDLDGVRDTKAYLAQLVTQAGEGQVAAVAEGVRQIEAHQARRVVAASDRESVEGRLRVGRQPAGKLVLRPRKKQSPTQRRNYRKWLAKR